MLTPPARRPLATLVTVLTLVTFELIRSSGPLLDMAFALGVTTAAGAALVTYLLPGLFAVVLVAASRRRPVVRAVVVGTVVLAGARLAAQAVDGWARFGVGLATVALALGVLTLAVAALASRAGGGAAAGAVARGAAGAVGLQLVLGTWDAYWRPGLTGWVVALAVAVTLVWLARRLPDDVAPEALAARPGRVWALGPVLGLSAMALANPAFAASQTGLPLALAGTVVAVGLLAAAWLAERERLAAAGTALVPAIGVAVVYLLAEPGALVLVTLVAAQLAVFVQLGRALEPRAGALRRGRVAASAALVGVLTVLPILGFQLDYDVPLGFPNALIPVGAALLAGLAGLRRVVAPDGLGAGAGPSAGPPVPESTAAGVVAPAGGEARLGAAAPGSTAADATTTGATAPGKGRGVVGQAWSGLSGTTSLVVAGALVAWGGALVMHLGDDAAAGADGVVTVVSWNVHYGVTPGGDVDLEALARTIEEQDACVVLLQEVSRGWVQGGGVDMATWLSHRLGLRMEFAPAADRQFGNAILSCTPARDVVVHALPYGAGPQHRSALSADVTAGGVTQRYTTVHLQHRESNTPTRLEQLEALLAADLGVLGGDLNSEPGWEEIELVLSRGFVSAQDAVGDPAELTSPAHDPRYRIDWVFVPQELAPAMAELTVLDTDASDHRPLVLRLDFEG